MVNMDNLMRKLVSTRPWTSNSPNQFKYRHKTQADWAIQTTWIWIRDHHTIIIMRINSKYKIHSRPPWWMARIIWKEYQDSTSQETQTKCLIVNNITRMAIISRILIIICISNQINLMRSTFNLIWAIQTGRCWSRILIRKEKLIRRCSDRRISMTLEVSVAWIKVSSTIHHQWMKATMR